MKFLSSDAVSHCLIPGSAGTTWLCALTSTIKHKKNTRDAADRLKEAAGGSMHHRKNSCVSHARVPKIYQWIVGVEHDADVTLPSGVRAHFNCGCQYHGHCGMVPVSLRR